MLVGWERESRYTPCVSGVGERGGAGTHLVLVG